MNSQKEQVPQHQSAQPATLLIDETITPPSVIRVPAPERDDMFPEVLAHRAAPTILFHLGAHGAGNSFGHYRKDRRKKSR